MNLIRTPLVIVTTIQPLLFLWILAISFFLGLAVASAISQGRTWQQTLKTILFVWIICSIIGIIGTNLSGITSFLVEWVLF